MIHAEILFEATVSEVPFVIHKHNPRSGSPHYDVRFLDPRDRTLLHSFAFGSDFEKKFDSKIVGVKTKDHDPRWLTLKSHRLDVFDNGTVKIKIASPKYYELEFQGISISGVYKLFKVKSRRDDNWLLIRGGAGIGQPKKYMIYGAVLTTLKGNARANSKKWGLEIEEELKDDPWGAIIKSKDPLTSDQVKDFHKNYSQDPDGKGVPYYFMVKDTSTKKNYVIFSDEYKWIPVNNKQEQIHATSLAIRKGLDKEQVNFVELMKEKGAKR